MADLARARAEVAQSDASFGKLSAAALPMWRAGLISTAEGTKELSVSAAEAIIQKAGRIASQVSHSVQGFVRGVVVRILCLLKIMFQLFGFS